MITPAFHDRVIAFIAPIFDNAATDAKAREAARASIADYKARGDGELRLAALAVAYSFAVLERLGSSMKPGLDIEQMLCMREDGVALGRAGEQVEKRLEKLRKEPVDATPLDPAADGIMPASHNAADMLAFAKTTLKALVRPPAAPPKQPAAKNSKHRRFAGFDTERKLTPEQVKAKQAEYVNGFVEFTKAKKNDATIH